MKDGEEITISCAQGEQGYVYRGALKFEAADVSLEETPETRTQIMINIASPTAAFRWWRPPCHGIGLARIEFIINNTIKIHPLALASFDEVEDKAARKRIQELTRD